MAHAFGFPIRSAGKSIIATEESRSNSSFGFLTTPDKVTDIVLPTDGLIFVLYQAMWKQSTNPGSGGGGGAALFLGNNQLKMALDNAAAPDTGFASITTATDTYKPLASSPLAASSGLVGNGDSTAYTGDVTTGQILGVASAFDGLNRGGIVPIFAAAGTYDVGVKFKAATGSVTAKNRKLWVWSMTFD